MWNQEPWLLVEYKSPVQNVIAYARIACLLIGMPWLGCAISLVVKITEVVMTGSGMTTQLRETS